MATPDSRKIRVLLPSIFPLRSSLYSVRFFPIAQHLGDDYAFTFIVKQDNAADTADRRNVLETPANVRIVTFRSWAELVRLTRRLSSEADILFPSKPFSVTGLHCYLLARRRRVVMVQDTDDLEWAGVQWYYPQEILIERFLMRRVRYASVASRGLLEYWPQAEYVPNCTLLNVFDPGRTDRGREAAATRQAHGFGSRPLLLWIAGGGPIDMVFPLRLLEAVRAKVPNLVLAVVGERPDLGKMRRRAADAEFAQSVRFLGRVTTDALRGMYLAADALLLNLRDHPYDRCKCPGRLAEPMAMGTPLIVTDVGEPAYVVREAGCGVKIPVHPTRAVEAVVDFLTRPEPERRQIGRRGREYLQRRRNWPNVVPALDGLFRRALARA
ncbi:MAG: glycosyltransferase family 4 protein [Kiritimatiellae bacterium]|nr:glycosyltransferase family 4 protein [Kiritimatiellia bacterium]